MAVGDTERLVENLVNRGLVAPSMVGRTVGQATIEELKNLGSAVGTSQATRQNEQEQRLSEFKSKLIQSGAFKTGSRRTPSVPKVGSIKDITKPFAVGYTKGSTGVEPTLAIASAGPKGLKIQSGTTDPNKNALVKLALENSGLSGLDTLPQINTQYLGGGRNLSSIQELLAEIAGQTSQTDLVKKLFGGI